MSGEADGGDAAMDTRDLKVSIADKDADGDRAGSPEQSGVSTPKYSEYQSSGSKRLRTKDGWEEVEGSEHGAGLGAELDEPGTSQGLLVATPEEVRQLQERTKSACSQLADIIVALRRERDWTEAKDAKTARKRELRLLLRSIERRLERLEPSPALESLRAYVGFALEKANPAPGFDHLLDDELQLILGKVALAANSPKQVLALAAVSKRFKKLIRHPAVWRRLDMSPHAAFLTDRLLLGMMKDDGAFALLRRVDLGGCTRVTDKAVCELLNVCGGTLETLILRGCTLIHTSTVAHAAATCPRLRTLDLAGCVAVDSLEALRLSDQHWPKMEELRLMGTSRLAGRVPQDQLAEFTAEVEARRERLVAAEAEAESKRAARVEMVLAGGYPPEVRDEMVRQIMNEGTAADTTTADAADDDAAATAASPGDEDASEGDSEMVDEEAARSKEGMVACGCKRSGGVGLGEVPEFVVACKRRLQAWTEGHPVAACDHAMVMQGAMAEHPYSLNLLPGCGHVLCAECEQKSRVNMVRRHADNEYVYPCPLCGHDMPNPGGFEITLQ